MRMPVGKILILLTCKFELMKYDNIFNLVIRIIINTK